MPVSTKLDLDLRPCKHTFKTLHHRLDGPAHRTANNHVDLLRERLLILEVLVELSTFFMAGIRQKRVWDLIILYLGVSVAI